MVLFMADQCVAFLAQATPLLLAQQCLFFWKQGADFLRRFVLRVALTLRIQGHFYCNFCYKKLIFSTGP